MRSEGKDQRAPRQAPADPASAEQIEYRLAALQQDLKLTPEQLGSWQSFASKVEAYAGDVERAGQENLATAPDADGRPGRGLQHIQRAVDIARDRFTALEEIETAAKAFYGALTADQRTLADVRLPGIVAPAAPNANARRTGRMQDR